MYLDVLAASEGFCPSASFTKTIRKMQMVITRLKLMFEINTEMEGITEMILSEDPLINTEMSRGQAQHRDRRSSLQRTFSSYNDSKAFSGTLGTEEKSICPIFSRACTLSLIHI